MRVLIVFNHPCRESLCSSVMTAVIQGLTKAGHEIDVINLDEDNFDPVIKTKDYQAFKCSRDRPINAYQLMDSKVINYKKRMEKANHIVFIFPLWRTLMPAMIKGFIDKLIFPGIAFDYNSDGSQIYCRLDKLNSITMITTMDTHSLLYRFFLSYLIKRTVLAGIFYRVGITNQKWMVLNKQRSNDAEKKDRWLKNICHYFAQL